LASWNSPSERHQFPPRRYALPDTTVSIDGRGTRERPYVALDTSIRIFVVDDEYTIAATLATTLNMNGFSARFFTQPLHALEAAQLDSPDLLISDVAMPGLSGIDLAFRIRAQPPAVKILLFSGKAASRDLLESARKQGHDLHLLLKPVHPSEFLSSIGTLVKSTPSTPPDAA
jgi:DNA-binding response OmpR family regulator